YTYYLTIPLALLQAVGQARIFQSSAQIFGNILPHFGLEPTQLLPTVTLLAGMTAGTMFAIWLGQLITDYGVGQALSIIILGGSASSMPNDLFQPASANEQPVFAVGAFLAIVIGTVLVIVVVQEGTRRIPVHYAKRVRGRKVCQGTSTYIPLKINTAGMIPLI